MPRTDQSRRDGSGRYGKARRCDACGKSVNYEKMFSDDEALEPPGADSPGFYLCARRACMKARDINDLETRRAFYRAQRERNDEHENAATRTPFERIVHRIRYLDPEISSVTIAMGGSVSISCTTDAAVDRLAEMLECSAPRRMAHGGDTWLTSERWAGNYKSNITIAGPHTKVES